MRNLTLLALFLALFLLRASSGHERLVVFGDSLSDNGNCRFDSDAGLVPTFHGFELNRSVGPNNWHEILRSGRWKYAPVTFAPLLG
jgi:hypothetical protein